jgi:hypothetical protein
MEKYAASKIKVEDKSMYRRFFVTENGYSGFD